MVLSLRRGFLVALPFATLVGRAPARELQARDRERKALRKKLNMMSLNKM